ncbi:hypothetical protein [Pseudomonas sp. B14(2017)]|uniref:hypothetical protein n=1 Tax=Pseudomonas sp. B14(2017) TaxID=1981745 RepID=UPI000A1D7536|nr:hypothetical protein [Pseudomonas sp. B14(2017)]
MTTLSITTEKARRFTAGYLEAALWSSSDTHPENGEHVSLDDYEWADGEADKACADIESFMAYAAEDLEEYAQRRQCPNEDAWECAGHDFWLTRNGHGVGYWDRGLGELGDRLSAAAKTFGCVDLYLGDNEEVYAA